MLKCLLFFVNLDILLDRIFLEHLRIFHWSSQRVFAFRASVMILKSVNFRPGTSPHTDVFRPKYRKANVQSRIQTYDVISCYHPSSHSLQQYNRPTRWIGLSQITPKHLRYDRYNGRYRATTVFLFLTLKCITLRQNSFFGLKSHFCF